MRKIILLLSSIFLIAGCEELTIEKIYDNDGIDIDNSIGSPRDKRLSFFDFTENNILRPIVNDLTGDLKGRVQFAQTHTINPSGNAEKNLPKLVPFRDALLLFTPELQMKSISVTAMKNGSPLHTFNMEPPIYMPKSDYNNTRGKPDVTYSKRSWSVNIPNEYIDPAVSFQFTGTSRAEKVYTGILDKNNIEYTTPNEGYLFFIQLGMLTDYPKDMNAYYMLTDPAHAIQDYFQTVPYAKYVNAMYEPRRLDVVMIGNGTIYDTSGKRGPRISNGNGDVYTGDLREDVGKAQVSTGINRANKGVVSGALDQKHNYGNDIFYMTVHHSQGAYQNGIQSHGLSGGNGIGTLYASHGNEFSHEVGHAYNMGHYPHGDESEGSRHSYNTGWGYDAYKYRMRANLNWDSNTDILPFKNIYGFNKDSMAGGWVNSSISRYTHNTAWSTMDIQNNMGNRYMLGKKGNGYAYYRWNKELLQYEEVTAENDAEFVKIRLNPTQVGVPVITILGAYDPDDKSADKSVIYPYFRGNYGNIFGQLFLDTKPEHNYYLQIEYYGKPTKYVELSPERYNQNRVNMFHLNIPESDKPKKISLYINGKMYNNANWTIIEEKVYNTPMPKAIIVGRDKDTNYGYEQVLEADIDWLNNELADKDVNTYTMVDKEKEIANILARNNKLDELKTNQKAVVEKYLNIKSKIEEIDLFIEKNYNSLENNDEKAISSLKNMLSNSGLGQIEFNYSMVRTNWYERNLEVYANEINDKAIRTISKSEYTNTANQNWVIDNRGRLHNEAFPGYCLDGGDLSKLSICSDSPSQQWIISEPAGVENFVYLQNRWNNKCLDYASGSQKFVLYQCKKEANKGYANQGFYPISKDTNIYLSEMNGNMIDELFKYLKPEKEPAPAE